MICWFVNSQNGRYESIFDQEVLSCNCLGKWNTTHWADNASYDKIVEATYMQSNHLKWDIRFSEQQVRRLQHSGTQQHVDAWKQIKVSDMCTASIIRAMSKLHMINWVEIWELVRRGKILTSLLPWDYAVLQPRRLISSNPLSLGETSICSVFYTAVLRPPVIWKQAVQYVVRNWNRFRHYLCDGIMWGITHYISHSRSYCKQWTY